MKVKKGVRLVGESIPLPKWLTDFYGKPLLTARLSDAGTILDFGDKALLILGEIEIHELIAEEVAPEMAE